MWIMKNNNQKNHGSFGGLPGSRGGWVTMGVEKKLKNSQTTIDFTFRHVFGWDCSKISIV